LLAVALIAQTLRPRGTIFTNYVYFADSLLHGHVWIDWPGPRIDAVFSNGRYYIVNDPVPGFLMLPLVKLAGLQANQTLLAVILAGVALGAAWKLFANLGARVSTSIWLCAFLLLGTDLWWCSSLGDVWFVAQTSAVAFTLLCLLELSGKNRSWLVALWFVLAIGSRFTLVMATPVILWLTLRGGLRASDDGPQEETSAAASGTTGLRSILDFRGIEMRRVLSLAIVLLPAFALWVAYNEVRWGVPWDSGHTIFYHQDHFAGSPTGSPFSIANIPMQLWSFLIQYPKFYPMYPYVVPRFSGVALTWTSPALICAFFARRPRRLVVAMWTATVLVAIPSLLYFVNGFSQFGMRHALDFEPFLIVLMTLFLRERFPLWAKVLLAYSIVVGAWGVWFWRVFYRPKF
jgi:hypothetical protein